MTRETELELDILREIDRYNNKPVISVGEFSTLLPPDKAYQPTEFEQCILQMVNRGLVCATQPPRLGHFGRYSGVIRATLTQTGQARLDELRRD